ncbi:hypothetical protein VaNZ11_006634, partial [Volvox africanus]
VENAVVILSVDLEKAKAMRTVRTLCPTQSGRRLGAVIVRQCSATFTDAAADPVWLDNLYCKAALTPPELQRAVHVAHLPSKGRGILANTDLEPGELLMVSKPLAYVTCPMGSIPSAEDLITVMKKSNYNTEELRILNSLFSGVDDEDNKDDTCSGLNLDDFKLSGIIGCNSFGEEFTDFPSYLARSHAHANGIDGNRNVVSGGAEHDTASWSNPPSGEEQVGHLGIFPSFSMLNHSCLPNAVNFVVGGRMLVVAARSIQKGSEVLINYLGRASLRPLEERQAQLAEGYYFSCDCPRCRAELYYCCTDVAEASGTTNPFGTLAECLQDFLARVDTRNSVLDQLGRAAAASVTTNDDGGDARAILDGLLDSVRQDVRKWDDHVQRAQPPLAAVLDEGMGPEVPQSWLHASAFDLYSQHAVLAEATGRRQEALAAVERQVAICEVVAPSSDLHMYLSVKLALLAQQQEQAEGGNGGGRDKGLVAGVQGQWEAKCGLEGGSDRVAAEWRRCRAVLQRRYGKGLSDGTLSTLLQEAVYGLSQVVV